MTVMSLTVLTVTQKTVFEIKYCQSLVKLNLQTEEYLYRDTITFHHYWNGT